MGIPKIRISAICSSPDVADNISLSVQSDASMCFVDVKRSEETIENFLVRTLPTIVVQEISTSADFQHAKHLQFACGLAGEGKIHALFMLDQQEIAHMNELYSSGALNIILTTDSNVEIHKAIACIGNGGHHISAAVFRSLPDLHIRSFYSMINARMPIDSTGDGSLSAREEIVLKLIAYGFSTKEIAAEMHISTKTVETYKSRAAEKLSLSSRAAIVKYGASRGWFNIY